jgi:hypothetical protein
METTITMKMQMSTKMEMKASMEMNGHEFGHKSYGKYDEECPNEGKEGIQYCGWEGDVVDLLATWTTKSKPPGWPVSPLTRLPKISHA